jgi:2-polyprenyl-6-methoxyphenol hydroxylase-like FAD-dependent oxidoreductase
MLLARQGLRVLVVDRGQYGSDTLSTHALMRGGVMQLHRWGVLDKLKSAGTPPIRTTSFHYGDEELCLPIKAKNGVDALYAPRRTVLDSLLVDAAREAGAQVEYGVRLVNLLRSEDGRVTGVVVKNHDGREIRVRANLVIGADGIRSSVARLVGSELRRSGRHASGVVFGYFSGFDIDGFHWYYRPGVSGGAIPTNDGLTCVFAAMPDSRFRKEIASDVASGYYRILRECDSELAREVGLAERVGNFRGFAGELGFMRRCWGPGWALVGDAGYFRDPITAHGITDAFIDAELLSRAVAQGTLSHYESLRNDLSEGLFDTTDFIASYEWNLQSVKEQHLLLSKEMNREVKMLTQLDAQELMLSSQPVALAS